MNKDITCSECESEFQIISEDNLPPEFCPYCGEKLSYDDKDLDDADWYDDEDEQRGC